MPTLYMLQGPDKGHNFEVNHTPVLIGRNSPDVPLTDNTISRRHAELTREDDVWSIRDLNSANGTYVNGVKLAQKMALKQGDQVRCGSTLIVFGGDQIRGIAGDLGGSLRIDEDGNIVESSIVATVASMDDSVIMAGPEASDAVGNLRLLYELSTTISTIFDREQLLEKVMDMIFDNLPADRGFILFKSETDGELIPEVVRYRSKEHSGKITISHTIVNHAIDNNEGVICTNAMRDPRFSKGESVHDFSIHSALCVPITIRDQNIGVIYVDTTMATNTYAAGQLRLLTAIGFQTGLALEHARLYQAGVQAERMAEAGETVAYLSHGIKNILQSLQASADLVEMGLTRNKMEVARKGWGIMRRNLARIHNLVLNMLAFSKVRQPNRVMTQLNLLITETVEMLTSLADDKQVALLMDLDDQMPAVAIDPDGIQQVLLNLILNAISAVEERHGVITVKAMYEAKSSYVVMTIHDNGKGIEPEQQQRLFTPFESNKGQGGTGLGLAVVKKLVEEHEGEVTLSSKPNEGTTFTIRIPTEGMPVADSGGTAGPGLKGRDRKWIFPRR
ncbi:MAG: FHA domain-containing protein [Planctomycetes bacterium]|nr:FHA domain-containing protein [Planctomycetota bacterium]